MGADLTESLEEFDLDTMQETGRAEYRLEDIADRVYTSVHRGRQDQWGSQTVIASDSVNPGLQHQYNIQGEFYKGLAPAVESITKDFYGTIRGLEVKNDYLQATEKELTSIVGSIEEASRLLEKPSNKKIRTIGDLTQRYEQIKTSRQAAASSLEVGSINMGPTVSYVDPLTGKTISRNQYQSEDPTAYLGTPSTEAFNEAKAYFRNRVEGEGEARANEEYSRFMDWWNNSDQQITQIGQENETGNPIFGYNVGNYDSVINNSQSGGTITEEDLQDILSQGASAFSSQGYTDAFNSLVGFTTNQDYTYGHGQIDMYTIPGMSEAQQEQIYNELASLTASTYGGLYSTAYDSIGATLAAANLGFGTADQAFAASKEQKYVAGQKQKALQESLKRLGETFSKGKQSLLPKEKDPLARFSGFGGGRPQ